MKTSIVLGLLFGDEGKGLVTSCVSKKDDLVVRFCGGHQAGHTVEKNGYRHIFSNFSSGTLNGAHTYWSEYCTFSPQSFINERAVLNKQGFYPSFFIHPLSMITTPFDIEFNRNTESLNKHGSVGVGFGATVQRNTQTPFKLFAIDLQNKSILTHKLNQIAQYYNSHNYEEKINSFVNLITELHLNVCALSQIKNNYKNIIFEGAQGVMLDMDFGYFPNVTRSNTTSKNAMQIIKDNFLPKPEIYYCMRSYLTRHGNGFMPNETSALCFEDKTNISHRYQGEFRQAHHSLELINHALSCDKIYSESCEKNIVITCLNQTNELIYIDGDCINVSDFGNKIPIKNIHISTSPTEIIKTTNERTNSTERSY